MDTICSVVWTKILSFLGTFSATFDHCTELFMNLNINFLNEVQTLN